MSHYDIWTERFSFWAYLSAHSVLVILIGLDDDPGEGREWVPHDACSLLSCSTHVPPSKYYYQIIVNTLVGLIDDIIIMISFYRASAMPNCFLQFLNPQN